MQKNYKVLAWAAAIGIVLIIALYSIEFFYISNTLEVESLVFRTAILMLLLGIYAAFHFQNKGEEQVDRIRIWSVCLLIPLFFAPWLGSLSNRLAPASAIEYKTLEFIESIPLSQDKQAVQEEDQKESGCFLFVYYKGKIQRLRRPTCEFENKKNGDEISLPVKKGLWGYEVILWD